MIPNKSNFKFQELTPITGVKPYVIRFWETEFEDIAPVTSDSGQKLYARKDVEVILKVKKLLFEEKLSISDAKLALKSREVGISSTVSISDQGTDPVKEQAFVKGAILSALNLIRDIKVKRNW